MNFVRGLIVLVVALILQAAMGNLWPESLGFVDVLLVPVALYSSGGTQRSAMLTGCAAGLLRDTWFQSGAFGLNGFKRTLLGWILGTIATRVDMNHAGGRLAAGCLISLGDDLLDLILRRLLDQPAHLEHVWEVVVKSGITGLLVALGGAILDRVTGPRERRIR